MQFTEKHNKIAIINMLNMLKDLKKNKFNEKKWKIRKTKCNF